MTELRAVNVRLDGQSLDDLVERIDLDPVSLLVEMGRQSREATQALAMALGVPSLIMGQALEHAERTAAIGFLYPCPEHEDGCRVDGVEPSVGAGWSGSTIGYACGAFRYVSELLVIDPARRRLTDDEAPGATIAELLDGTDLAIELAERDLSTRPTTVTADGDAEPAQSRRPSRRELDSLPRSMAETTADDRRIRSDVRAEPETNRTDRPASPSFEREEPPT